MTEAILHLKTALRAELRAALRRISAEERARASGQVCVGLARQKIWESARSILFYASLAEEIDVQPLLRMALEQCKEAALPRFDAETNAYVACRVRDPSTELGPGRFGVMEPPPNAPKIPLKQLDLVLVPGVGFDLNGRRLGRGKGYYDRLLARVSGMKCGIGFDQQIVKEIPATTGDVRMSCILTPTRWLQLGSSAVLK